MFSGVNLVECLECNRLFNSNPQTPFFCPFCKKKEPLPNKVITIKAQKTGVCVYCGDCGIMTKDHVIPKSKGGRTVLPCCRRCNVLKADFSLSQFLHNIQNNIGNCAFLQEIEKQKIIEGIIYVINLKIEN